jgi:hypothetical protein
MIDKSVIRKNEAFERENFSLALKIVRRRRANFFAVWALRGVPARKGSERPGTGLKRGGDFPLQKICAAY